MLSLLLLKENENTFAPNIEHISFQSLLLIYFKFPPVKKGFPVLSDKESTCSAGDAGLSLAGGDPLKEEMATHSTVLAWEGPWTEKPGRP